MKKFLTLVVAAAAACATVCCSSDPGGKVGGAGVSADGGPGGDGSSIGDKDSAGVDAGAADTSGNSSTDSSNDGVTSSDNGSEQDTGPLVCPAGKEGYTFCFASAPECVDSVLLKLYKDMRGSKGCDEPIKLIADKTKYQCGMVTCQVWVQMFSSKFVVKTPDMPDCPYCNKYDEYWQAANDADIAELNGFPRMQIYTIKGDPDPAKKFKDTKLEVTTAMDKCSPNTSLSGGPECTGRSAKKILPPSKDEDWIVSKLYEDGGKTILILAGKTAGGDGGSVLYTLVVQ